MSFIFDKTALEQRRSVRSRRRGRESFDARGSASSIWIAVALVIGTMALAAIWAGQGRQLGPGGGGVVRGAQSQMLSMTDEERSAFVQRREFEKLQSDHVGLTEKVENTAKKIQKDIDEVRDSIGEIYTTLTDYAVSLAIAMISAVLGAVVSLVGRHWLVTRKSA